jgi:hypothetical protein
MSQSKLVLVTGATGKQGGACVEALLTRGHQVRALTRNSASPAARRLHEQGIEIAVGDFTDYDSLVRAARGVDAVYAMSTPYEQGAEKETAQGITIADAPKRQESLISSTVRSPVQTAPPAFHILTANMKSKSTFKHPVCPAPSSRRSTSWRICCSRGAYRACVGGSSLWHCLRAARCNKSPPPTSARSLQRSLSAVIPSSVVALTSPEMS